jgi:hypothetical protein
MPNATGEVRDERRLIGGFEEVRSGLVWCWRAVLCTSDKQVLDSRRTGRAYRNKHTTVASA